MIINYCIPGMEWHLIINNQTLKRRKNLNTYNKVFQMYSQMKHHNTFDNIKSSKRQLSTKVIPKMHQQFRHV